MDVLDSLCIYFMLLGVKAKERVEDFWDSQDGVSNVVATIILVLIVVLIIGVFWDKLQEWLKGMIDKITGTEITAGKLE